jgi:protein-S-isoprenylcysteine O-methyltransferase
MPLLLHDTAAHTALAVLLVVWSAGEFILQHRVRKQSHATFDWTYYVVVASLVLGIVLGFRLAGVRATLIDSGWWLVVGGLAIFSAGVAFRFWAMLVLGRFFTFQVSIQDEHRVVANGPYRFVRHPGYTGLLAASAGLGIACSNVLSLALMILLPLAGVLVRIRVEERALTRALGDAYVTYARGRARLIPGIW